MPASTVLLLETDAAAGEAITTTLTRAGYTVNAVADADEAFARTGEHQIVIIDVVAGDKTAVEVCREIRSSPDLSTIPVLCIGQSDDVEERIRFLEAGADDVIARPFDERELEARVEALLLRFQRSRRLAPTATGDGALLAPSAPRIVTVFSPKGGVGTTTIATNIAVAVAQRRPDKVVLVDLDLQFGQAATHLNLQAKQSLADVVRDEAALREPELLRTYSTRHDIGLHLLASPPTPELADLVEPSHVGQLLETAIGTWDSVVVDAGSTLDERTMIALERADTVLVPVYPEIAALKAVTSLLEYLAEVGSVGVKAVFVVNNVFAREILKLRDIEMALGTKVGSVLPYDGFLYLKAVNEGIPIVRGAPRSQAAERLSQLAVSTFALDGVADATPAVAADSRRGGLLARLRR